MFETAVDSFILRFVREQSPDTPAGTAAWYGVIRHVQSNEQIRFTRIDEALSFMDAYVAIAVAIAEQGSQPADDRLPRKGVEG